MKKNINKTLIIVLLVLVAAFVLTRMFRSPARESNLNTDLFRVDTTLIHSMVVTRSGDADLKIQKSNSGVWTVSSEAQNAKVETATLDRLLSTLMRLKPERVVSRKEEKWKTYYVDDSTSIHFTAFDRDNEPVIDWHVGKESPQGLTYIRAAEENAVYAFEGNLRGALDKDFNGWRDKTFLEMKSADVDLIKFEYPADSGFVLQKNAGKWTLDGQQADSTAVQRFLNRVQSRTLSNFATTSPADEKPSVTVTINRSNNSPITLKCWNNAGSWTLTSSIQPGVYFAESALPADIFVSKKALAAK